MQVLAIQVSEGDFLAFMLAELQLVDDIELANIAAMFHAMDISGDGKLSMADVRARITQSRTGRLPDDQTHV